jgi:Synergist-CTERM protein sorting domain-containing protein
LNGTPANYTTQLAALQPGDTLQLAAGTYTNRLVIDGMNGSASAWYTIEGPSSGTATFNGVAGNNTVSLRNCSFIAIKNITVDCLGLAVDGIKAEGYTTTPHVVHDMLIENVVILNAGANQQIVGINTKCPCWNWTIRGCEIIGAGTGLYLGNSTGNDPFVRGVIESNRVYDPEGYCMEIKHQNNWPAGLGLPTGTGRTIIRNNVFIKTSRASGSGDRPNLLFGGYPDSGDGANDTYQVYGNFIASNPRESLIQATGRFTIHDNILVDAPDATFAGIYVTAHQGKSVLSATIYNNTIYACGRGIRVASGSTADAVVGNLVFSSNAISGTITTNVDNMTDTVANAGNYVANPSTTLGSMDFYPLAGQCTGSALNLSAFATDNNYDLDFNGDSKAGFTYRGAYAGSGANPGWAPGNTLKTGGPGTGPTPPAALAIQSPAAGALPDAEISDPYSRTFTATGGTAPYTWSITSGGLPAGLTLAPNGVLSGTPTVTGTASFAVTVTDALSATDQRNYTLQVVLSGHGGPPGSGDSGCSVGAGAAWWLLALPVLMLRRRKAE